jgi:hypothetical protein
MEMGVLIGLFLPSLVMPFGMVQLSPRRAYSAVAGAGLENLNSAAKRSFLKAILG